MSTKNSIIRKKKIIAKNVDIFQGVTKMRTDRGVPVMEITGSQIRAARAFLDWTITRLSDAAGVSDSTIRSIEKMNGPIQITGGLEPTLDYRTSARAESVKKLADVLEASGITFLTGAMHGVGMVGRKGLSAKV